MCVSSVIELPTEEKMEEGNPVGLISATTRLCTGSLVSVGSVLKHRLGALEI